jgi:putative spermidine/putrescine transport system permease protein
VSGLTRAPALQGRRHASSRRLRVRRRLGPYALLVPSLLLVAMFLWAMGLLLSHSFHAFEGGLIQSPFTLSTWRHFLGSGFYWSVIRETVELGVVVTAVCLALGYPTAYVLARIENRFALVLSYILLFAPLLVSVVVRSYGWLLLLGDRGVVNDLIKIVPGTHAPYRLIYNQFGVTVALVHILLPFAVFPILSVMRQLPPGLDEAAADLGAKPGQAFRRVVLPLSLPGVVSAAQIVFTLTISAWVTAVLLGGGRVLVLAKLVYDNISQLNWPLGAVEAWVLLVVALLALALFSTLGRTVRIGRDPR